MNEESFKELLKLNTHNLSNPYDTIENLRRLAELNFTPEDYQKYLAMIQPGIKSIIPKYLDDWQGIEEFVMLTTMRHAGVFKTTLSFNSINENTEKIHGDKIDVERFKEIKAWKLWRKLEYLRDNGVLGESSFNFLNALKEKRNRIHERGTVFSEKELREFSIGYSIISYIHNTELPIWPTEKERLRIRNMAEKWAEEALKFANKS